MPWSPKQHRFFEWAAHNPDKARAEGHDIKQGDAAKMAAEGIRKKGREANGSNAGAGQK